METILIISIFFFWILLLQILSKKVENENTIISDLKSKYEKDKLIPEYKWEDIASIDLTMASIRQHEMDRKKIKHMIYGDPLGNFNHWKEFKSCPCCKHDVLFFCHIFTYIGCLKCRKICFLDVYSYMCQKHGHLVY